jgi:hypothetical protein
MNTQYTRKELDGQDLCPQSTYANSSSKDKAFLRGLSQSKCVSSTLKNSSPNSGERKEPARMKKFLSAISLGIVALLLSPAVAAATDAKGVAKNVSDTLDSIAGSGYKGVVAIIALTLLGTRQFIAVAIFLVFCLVVGLVVFMTPQFIDLIKNTWTGLGL